MIRFRHYQRHHLPQIVTALRGIGRVLLAYCVGAGKTVMALAAAAQLARKRDVSHVLVIVPNRIIARQFLKVFGRVVDEEEGEETEFLPVWNAPSSRRKTDLILDYLNEAEPGSVFVGTYRVFSSPEIRSLIVERAKALGSSLLLIADEAHHVHADDDVKNDVSEARLACLPHGMRSLRLSGTPERADMRPVYEGDEEFVCRRSLSQQMLDGYAPSPLYAEKILVNDDDRDAAKRIVEHMAKDGWPKCIVRCKNVGSRDAHQRFVDALRTEMSLARKPSGKAPSMLSLYTQDESFSEDVLADYMEKEKSAASADDLPDAVVLFSAGAEGGDFPSRSHIYLYGCPESIPVLEQIIGRVLRLRVEEDQVTPRYAGYPREWLHASKTVFVVAGVDTDAAIAQTLLEMMTYISSFESIAEMRRLIRLQDGITAAHDRKRPTGPKLDFALVEEVEECCQHIEARFKEVRSEFDEPLRQTDVAAIIEACGAEILGRPFNWTSKETKTALVLAESRRNPVVRDRLEKLTMAFAEQDVPDAIQQALDKVYEDFKEQAYVGSGLIAISGALTEHLARSVHEILKGTADAPKTVEEVVAGVEAFRAANGGAFPALSDHDPTRPGWTFSQYERRLFDGNFARFAVEEWGSVDWWSTLDWVVRDIELRKNPIDPRLVSLVRETTESIARTRYRHVPEMAYFPSAWRAVKRFGEAVRGMSLAEADRIGRMTVAEAEKVIAGRKENDAA